MSHSIPTYSSRASLHALSACTPTDLELLHSLILLGNGSPLDPVRRDSTASSGSGTAGGSGVGNEVLGDSPPTPVSLRYSSPTETEGTSSNFPSPSSPRASGSRVVRAETEPAIEHWTKHTGFPREPCPARNMALKAAHAKSKGKELKIRSPEKIARMRREREEEHHRGRLETMKEKAAARAIANAQLVDTVEDVPLYRGSDNDESEEEVEVVTVDSGDEGRDEQVEVVSGDDNPSSSNADKEGWQDLCAVSIDAYGFGVPFKIRCERSESLLALELRHLQVPKTHEEIRQLQDAGTLLLDMRDKALKSHEEALTQNGDETESEDEGEREGEEWDDGPGTQATPDPLAEYLATGTQAVVNGRLVLVLNTPRTLHLASTATTIESDAAREARIEAARVAMPPPLLPTPEPSSKRGKTPVKRPTPASRKRKAPTEGKNASEVLIEDSAAEAISGPVVAKPGMADEISASEETGSGKPKRKRQKTVMVEEEVKEEKAEQPVRSRGGKGRVLKKTKKFGEE